MRRPILLPDVDTFAELLEYHGEWNHKRYNHHAGVRPATAAELPAPRYIGEPRVSDRTGRVSGANEIGPFCSTRNLEPAHRSMAVRATDLVLEVVAPRIVTPDDHLSFELIGHADGRALVVLQHGYISGSHWLARIDPATIPAYPFTARDTAAAAVLEEIKTATGWHPYSWPQADDSLLYGYSAVQTDAGLQRLHTPVKVARIAPDGEVERLASLDVHA